MATYDIIARRLITDRSKQSWLLSLPMTGLLSVLGAYHATRWSLTGDVSETAFTVVTARLVKCYMLVELCSELFFNFDNIAILETVIHHVAYYCFVDHIIGARLSGYLQPFYLFEIPAFMRTVSHIFPQYEHDLAFGVCFGLFRVGWPIYIMAVLPFPAWYYYIFVGSIELVHIYWMIRWFNMTR
jgi:hypothetical protein